MFVDVLCVAGSNAECVLASLVRLSDNVDLMHDFYKVTNTLCNIWLMRVICVRCLTF